MYTDFGNKAIEEAEKQGASYTDIRINEILKEALTIKNGDPEIVTMTQTKGFGIRVIVGGAWGFAG